MTITARRGRKTGYDLGRIGGYISAALPKKIEPFIVLAENLAFFGSVHGGYGGGSSGKPSLRRK